MKWTLSTQRYVDVLDLRAREELLDRLLTSQAGLLDAAERHADVVRRRAVDPDVTRFDARGEPVRAVEVVRPDRRGEPVVERVDPREEVVLGTPAQDRYDRPEDFLARDPHVVGHVGEHRGLDEEATRELRVGRPLATVCEARAALEPELDVAHRLVELRPAR